MPIDPNSIGQDRPVQNPDEASKQSEGTYQDPVERMSPQEKTDFMPKAPDPQPFTIRGPAGGSR